MKGIVFDIQRFSIYDGPGIRTTVFLKGCNLKCIWCHNPESFLEKPQLSYDTEKCIGCESCKAACINNVHEFIQGRHMVNFNNCIACGSCIEECPANALKIIGKVMDSKEVMEEVFKDIKYYENSEGGVTFSGGESTIQFEFLLELLKISKENNIHTAVETNGVISEDKLVKLIEYVDLFLFDYKATDPIKHKQFTGADNKVILANLKLLNKNNCPVILRCPIIQGLNDEEEHFTAIKNLKRIYSNIKKAEVMAYHNIGKHKWEKIGLCYTLGSLGSATKEQKESWQKMID